MEEELMTNYPDLVLCNAAELGACHDVRSTSIHRITGYVECPFCGEHKILCTGYTCDKGATAKICKFYGIEKAKIKE